MRSRHKLINRCFGAALIAWSSAALWSGAREPTPAAVFVFEQHPDLPLLDYARGRLGIVQPTYARSYLYVAYRWMQGVPLTGEEVAQVGQYWDERLRGPAKLDLGPSPAEAYDAARGALPIPWQAPTRPNDYANKQHLAVDYVYYSKCSDDAFRKAADTLEARIRQFGERSREVAVWVRGQDHVFENCFGAGSGFIPPPAPAGIHPLIRRDRDYQIAAALFYSSRYGQAASAFLRIAADRESPWSGWGQYLAGRARLWDARTHAEGSAAYRVKLYQAIAELRIAEEEGTAEAREAARWLTTRILMRLEPVEAARTLSRRLASPKESETRASDLMLFTQLLDRLAGEPDLLHEVRRHDDLVDWIFTFQNGDTNHALEKWGASGSVAWLAAALASIEHDHPAAPALMNAARKLGEHPSAATLAYHRATLLSVQGERDAAAALLEALVRDLPDLPSSRNRALGLRAMLANDAQELLLYGVRPPALLTYDLGPSGHLHAWQLTDLDGKRLAALQAAEGPYWGPETAEILNDAVAIDALAAMVAPGGSPTRAQTELLLAAWTRAVLLDRWDLVRSLASGIVQAAPSTRPDIEALLGAASPDRTLYFAARALLKLPGASVTLRSGPLRLGSVDQIDPYGRNWWAAPSAHAEILDFLAEDQRRTIAAEWDRIRAAGDGYAWLLRQAIAEAERPDPHATAAETLYLALAPSERTERALGRDPAAIREVQRRAIAALERRFSPSNWSNKLAQTGR